MARRLNTLYFNCGGLMALFIIYIESVTKLNIRWSYTELPISWAGKLGTKIF